MGKAKATDFNKNFTFRKQPKPPNISKKINSI